MNRCFSVVVLCPNARRETIKVTPNSSILQVLEEACKKQNINPEDFDLRHSNKILDLTLPIRFSNLPNNAQLELRPAQNSRKDCMVTVCLQLESGERITNDFSPSSTIHSIVEQCLRSKSICVQDIGEPVCIYMRQKIAGDSIKTTTLRSLGLTSGKAIIRLLYRKPEELEHQAHISSPLIATTNVKPAEIQQQQEKPNSPKPEHSSNIFVQGQDCVLPKIKTEFTQTNKERNVNTIPLDIKAESIKVEGEINVKVIPLEVKTEPIKVEENDLIPLKIKTKSIKTEVENSVSIDVDHNLNMVTEETLPVPMEHSQSNSLHDEEEKCNDMNENIDMGIAEKRMKMECDSEMPEEDTFEGISDIKYIGEKHAVLYDLNDVSEIKKADLPDEFFDLTLDDAKYLLAEYKRQSSEMENQPLLTKEQRQRKILQKLAQYSQTVIRIYFPERLVLQAVFDALETVQDVSHFVRNYLEDKDLKFYLYITPPKEKLNPSKTLLEALLVPAAVIYFGCDTQLPNYLMSSLRDKLSDPRAAALAASEARKNSISSVPVDIPCQNVNTTKVEEKVFENTIENVNTVRATTSNSEPEKVPKWLKLSRK